MSHFFAAHVCELTSTMSTSTSAAAKERAPERTTEEFLAEIEAGGPLTVSQCIVLKQFLAQCDLVKFAMHVPTEQQHLEAMAIAENFVLATRPLVQQGVRA